MSELKDLLAKLRDAVMARGDAQAQLLHAKQAAEDAAKDVATAMKGVLQDTIDRHTGSLDGEYYAEECVVEAQPHVIVVRVDSLRDRNRRNTFDGQFHFNHVPEVFKNLAAWYQTELERSLALPEDVRLVVMFAEKYYDPNPHD